MLACKLRSTRPATQHHRKTCAPLRRCRLSVCFRTYQRRSRPRWSTRSTERCPSGPTASRCTPSCSASSNVVTNCSNRAWSTGRSPKQWRSARCSPKAPPCASPARTAAAARSRIATRRSSTTTPAKTSGHSTPCVATARSSTSTTRCSANTPLSVSSTATRCPTPTHSSCGKPSSVTSSTAPRS